MAARRRGDWRTPDRWDGAGRQGKRWRKGIWPQQSPEHCRDEATLSQLPQGVFSPSPTTQRYADTCSVPRLGPVQKTEHLSTAAPVTPAPPKSCPTSTCSSGSRRAHPSPGAGNPTSSFWIAAGSLGTWPYLRWNRGQKGRWLPRHESRAGVRHLSDTAASHTRRFKQDITPEMLSPILVWNYLMLPRWILHSFLVQNLLSMTAVSWIVFLIYRLLFKENSRLLFSSFYCTAKTMSNFINENPLK